MFLGDFQRHWPTDSPHTYVDFVRDRLAGNGAARSGNARWKRLTEERAGSARSVFHFDVQGQLAKSTHAGIPWLFYLKRQSNGRVHFWPLDGWQVPAGKPAVVEVYPALWKHAYPVEQCTADQHDAFTVATWLREADRCGQLTRFPEPTLTPPERMVERCRRLDPGGWVGAGQNLLSQVDRRDLPALVRVRAPGPFSSPCQGTSRRTTIGYQGRGSDRSGWKYSCGRYV
jgi:hypothetical protein